MFMFALLHNILQLKERLPLTREIFENGLKKLDL